MGDYATVPVGGLLLPEAVREAGRGAFQRALDSLDTAWVGHAEDATAQVCYVAGLAEGEQRERARVVAQVDRGAARAEYANLTAALMEWSLGVSPGDEDEDAEEDDIADVLRLGLDDREALRCLLAALASLLGTPGAPPQVQS